MKNISIDINTAIESAKKRKTDLVVKSIEAPEGSLARATLDCSIALCNFQIVVLQTAKGEK